MLKDKGFLTESLLVLENANPSIVLEDHLPIPCDVPILVTSTDPTISNWTLNSDYFFHLPESANQKVVYDLVKSIEKSIDPGQRATTLVANGGSGKTQVALKFIATYASR